MSQSLALEPARLGSFHHHPTRMVADLAALLEVAQSEFERDRDAALASITRAALILQSELQRHTAGAKPNGGPGKLAGWQVQRLHAYIDSHLSETIHVSDLSCVAKRSISHFCRAFKRTFGETPHSYVTARRVHRAKVLMLDDDEQLSAIALICGFADQAHFSKVFRQHTGETPRGWRFRHHDATS